MSATALRSDEFIRHYVAIFTGGIRERKIMTENAFTLPVDKPHSLQRPRAFNAILYGGLAVGVLDGMAAVILTLVNGRSPSRMFQASPGD